MDIRGGVCRTAGVEDDGKSWDAPPDAHLPKFALPAELKRTTGDGLGASWRPPSAMIEGGRSRPNRLY